ncbi:hypothetical protein [Segetibacter koreensis]|uniref:hypothetical protein n=1 Tax=Segetibacter koreensis TaxID=398037 RepID=UPI0003717CBD|nr:hypothetical protein [Segetibacter koreensis]
MKRKDPFLVQLYVYIRPISIKELIRYPTTNYFLVPGFVTYGSARLEENGVLKIINRSADAFVISSSSFLLDLPARDTIITYPRIGQVHSFYVEIVFYSDTLEFAILKYFSSTNPLAPYVKDMDISNLIST